MVAISLLRGGRALEASTLHPAAKSARATQTTRVQRIVYDMVWFAEGESRWGGVGPDWRKGELQKEEVVEKVEKHGQLRSFDRRLCFRMSLLRSILII